MKKPLMRIPEINKGDAVAVLDVRGSSIYLLKLSVLRVAKNWITLENALQIHRVTGATLSNKAFPELRERYTYLGPWSERHSVVLQRKRVDSMLHMLEASSRHPTLNDPFFLLALGNELEGVHIKLRTGISARLRKEAKERRQRLRRDRRAK